MDFGYLSSICFSARRHYDWYADSGATQHMTDQWHILNNFEPIAPGTWTVAGIGNNCMAVLGQGEVEYSSVVNGVTHTETIQGVLYVQWIGANLFSIASATDAGSEVHFIDNKIHIFRQRSIKMVGQLSGKTLYHLNLVVKGKPACTIHFKTCVNIVSYIKGSHSQSGLPYERMFQLVYTSGTSV